MMCSLYCEGEGGTGSAFNKGYNNAIHTHNCYNHSVISRTIVLKSFIEEVGSFFYIVPTSYNYIIKNINSKNFKKPFKKKVSNT